ncbi:Nucleoid-associated protein [Koleobacter methoxysyntrophicus]|uniref:Nucleoid-associated protein n=1 Tax=Koleobacter methoxysyntrophicus TaxID=2751313 RepID=A0A8A0RNU6_9FIRM|nr:YbaB/EbfC family nucleoid-associated protein [Koleobacter methoxysyntrophicus]QSQ09544.1 Nucleoid-associated protein [Koleobacter methoxysyntrophicus]
MFDNLNDLVKKFKDDLKSVQQHLKMKTVDIEKKGMVSIKANGLQEIVEVNIDPKAFESGIKQELETALKSAINEVIEKSRKMVKDEISGIAGDIDLDQFDDLL